MANENQNLTNPDNLVDIRLLDYFEGKIGDKYATKAALQTKSNINHNHDSIYVKKAGDTMTGDLTHEGNVFLITTNNRKFGFKKTLIDQETGIAGNVDVGWDWENRDGSGAFFRNNDATGNATIDGQTHPNEGMFGMFARSRDQVAQLQGFADGMLAWNGSEVITKSRGNVLYAEHGEVTAERTRAMTKEAQLQGQIIRPVNMDTLTPSSTFTANQCVAINGVFYRAIRNTASFPVTLVVDGTTGKFVYNESASGHKAYVIGNPTLNEDWEVWSDSSIDFWREYFDDRLDAEADDRADDIEEVKGLIDDEADARKADVEALREAIGYSAEFVDLGLPSGTLWAKCNIGADAETGYGNYYMYGKGSTQYNSSDSAYTGTENPLAAEADTATQVLGAPWHMPTKAQFEELIANTTYTWEENFKGSGISGAKYTSRTDNTKYVFFPAAGDIDGSAENVGEFGQYWSSTPHSNIISYNLEVAEGYNYVTSAHRSYGYSVRPVCDSAPLVKMSSKADKKDVYTKAEVDALIQDVLSRIS